MNLEEQLIIYKKETQLKPTEANIQETIQSAKEAFFRSEQERVLPYREFLWSQLQLIRKPWWILQFLLLSLLGAAMVSGCEDVFVQKGMGIMASLFVILIIPELWKNRSSRSMEIEESSYYTLRQIYSARMVLFGIVDVFLLTVFCAAMTLGLHVAFTKLLIQFLLPMLVTACICFGTLCSRYIADETAAVILCILWSGAWLILTLNETLYAMLTLPVWLSCIALAFGFLCFTVYRTLNNCCWEVGSDEIRID